METKINVPSGYEFDCISDGCAEFKKPFRDLFNYHFEYLPTQVGSKRECRCNQARIENPDNYIYCPICQDQPIQTLKSVAVVEKECEVCGGEGFYHWYQTCGECEYEWNSTLCGEPCIIGCKCQGKKQYYFREEWV
jgi:hypothetical protein